MKVVSTAVWVILAVMFLVNVVIAEAAVTTNAIGTTSSTRPDPRLNQIIQDSSGMYWLGAPDSADDPNVWNSSDGITWGSVELRAGANTRDFNIFANSSGTPFLLVYFDSSANDVDYATYDGSTWTDQGTIAAFDGNATHEFDNVRGVIDSNDVVHFCVLTTTWDGSADGNYIFYGNYSAGTWSGRVEVNTDATDDSTECHIAVDSSNEVYIISTGEDGDTDLWSSRAGFGSANEYQLHDTGFVTDSLPFIFIDEDDRIYVLYDSTSLGNGDGIIYANSTVANWNVSWTIAEIEESDPLDHAIKRAYNKDLHVLWDDGNDVVQQLNLSNGEGTWSDNSTLITAPGPNPPALNVLGSTYPSYMRINNQIQFIWHNDTNNNLYLSSYSINNNTLPTLNIADTNISHGLTGFVVQANGTDADGDTLTFGLQNDTLGKLTINSTTGNITVSDLAGTDEGSYNITVNATDGAKNVSVTFLLTVIDDVAPVLNSFNIADADGLGSFTTGEVNVIRELQVNATEAANSIDSVIINVFRDGSSVNDLSGTLSSGLYTVQYSFPTSGDYTFNVTMNDTLSNAVSNVTGSEYSATIPSEAPAPGGGGGSPPPKTVQQTIFAGDVNASGITIETKNGRKRYDLLMRPGQVRILDINIGNLIDKDQTVEISCIEASVEAANPDLDNFTFCDVVEYSAGELTLIGDELQSVTMVIAMPEEFDFGDIIQFNTQAVNQDGDLEFLAAKITLSRATFINSYFEKWGESYDFGRFAFPKFLAFLVISAFIGLVGFVIPKTGKAKTGLFLTVMGVSFIFVSLLLP